LQVGEGENSNEIEKALWNLKQYLPYNPLMITVDFAPAWFEPIKKVFPNSEIQICIFHVMQEVVRALNKELIRFKRQVYDRYIDNAKRLARNTLKFQKTGKFLKLNLKYKILNQIQDEFLNLKDLINENNPKIVETQIQYYIAYLYTLSWQWADNLADELIERLPNNGLTSKNLKYYRKNVLKAFRKVLRRVRGEKEATKNNFLHVKKLILKGPEKFSSNDHKELTDFLKLNPQFMKIRTFFLTIHGILQFTPSKVNENMILKLKLWQNAGNKLKSALNTLKNNVSKIFTYTKFLKTDEDLNSYRRIRVNRECDMSSSLHQFLRI
jgi:hypothetical protein